MKIPTAEDFQRVADACPTPHDAMMDFMLGPIMQGKSELIAEWNRRLLAERRDQAVMTALVFKRELRRNPKFSQTRMLLDWVKANRELLIEWNEGYDTDLFVLELP